MNKVIFLDVDGVLNNETWAIEMFEKGIRVYHDDLLYEPSYYIRVVFIDLSPEVCYTVGDAVDWCHVPTARRFKGGSNHSPLPDC